MSSLITHPENLTKDRLKEELTKYSVKYSPTQSKDYYVQLYREKIMRRASTGRMRSEFSSGDEMASSRRSLPSRPKRYTKAFNVDHFLEQISKMSDAELRRRLQQFKVDVGPLTDTTRSLYAKSLAKLMVEDAKVGVSRSPNDDYEDLSSDGESEEEQEISPSSQPRQTIKLVATSHRVESSQYSRRSLDKPESWDRSWDRSQTKVQKPHIPSSKPQKPKPDLPPQKVKPTIPPKETTPPKSSTWRWIFIQLVVLVTSFISALIVFDYMMYGDSRVVQWCKHQYDRVLD